MMRVLRLTDQDVATAVAALRFYQWAAQTDPADRSAALHRLATAAGTVDWADDTVVNQLVRKLGGRQRPPYDMPVSECVACHQRFYASELAEITKPALHSISQQPPSGSCPECGGLCHICGAGARG